VASHSTHSRTNSAGITNPLPATRKMTVIAQDPKVLKAPGKILMATVDVPAEDLAAGPIGYRVQVVDFDATNGTYYGAHTLPESFEKEPLAWQEGRKSLLDDYRFHAQNVYALVMRTLARFEFALGRRVGWQFEVHQIKVAPHGMEDANAFYTRAEEGLILGYFAGLKKHQVFTCLSHDVVVHETTHALVDGLRRRYLDPSGPDQAAFHEGIADVVALLSVFSQVELVETLLRRNLRKRKGVPKGFLHASDLSASVLRDSVLFGLAEEMGQELETVRGGALRQSAKLWPPDPKWIDSDEFQEPHRRGELFVAAVINGFIDAWTERLHKAKAPDQTLLSARRAAEEGSDIAEILATMWIRGLDYMPPVHVVFGDALSAALTADNEVRPDDSRYRLREKMLKSFKGYGIAPISARKDPAGTWDPAPANLSYDRVRFESMRFDADEVFRFMWDNRGKDKLDLGKGDVYTKVLSVRPCVRRGFDGFILHETVAEYYQVAQLTPQELSSRGVKLPDDYLASLVALRKQEQDSADLPRTAIYGGGVLVFDEYGKLKFHISNKLFSDSQTRRLEYLWSSGQLQPSAEGRRTASSQLADLHRARALDTSSHREEW
jgi:hypothetical protein